MLLWTLYEQRGADIHYSASSGSCLYYFYDFLLFGLPAAIIGGVTGFVAAILNRRS